MTGFGDVDVHATPGVHFVNGRWWRTTCEPYSQTERCRSEIKAKFVNFVNGKFVVTEGWAFNVLTYQPSPRSLWKGNPLGGNGKEGATVSWTAADGRAWRTECDTQLTGRGACRSYAKVDLIETVSGPSGTTYRWASKWVVNNIVRFSDGAATTPGAPTLHNG